MSGRGFLEQHSQVVAVVAVVILIGAGVGVVRSLTGGGGPRPARRVYFLDGATGELIADVEQPSPMTTQGGGTAYRAYVFACGRCDNPDDRFIAYLQKLNERAMAETRREPVEHRDELIIAQGTFISAVESGRPTGWLPAGGAAANSIRAQPFERCADVRECVPGSGE